ncbi:unnamed protein product [Nezara viridula]|uniref:Mononegavirus-type SAM-dependent 2'-O-MTase domain-containing protein n=1 Tax=Nezara viridula TaxID=85310 RepID=A0A9P0MQ68_NEZVI|nr:unnamed protein product [Nezara viridula]
MQLGVTVDKHSTITRTGGLASGLASAVKSYVVKNRQLFWRACAFTVFNSDFVFRQGYYWRTFLCPLLRTDPSITPPMMMGIRSIPTIEGNSVTDWLQKIGRDETRGLLLSVPFPEPDSISIWRDLKGKQSEHLSPLCPLSVRLEQLRIREVQPHTIAIPFDSQLQSFTFSEEELALQGRGRSPLWVKWVHHCTRSIGKISTSASKLHQVISTYRMDQDTSGLVVTLAEGSGGILNYLAHLLPRTNLIYNTLQSDIVEVKENVLNISPPALIGDQCDLNKRLVSINETCLGETDITTPEFQGKLGCIMSRTNAKVVIFSMDAELKTDITNTDKLITYLPLVKSHLRGDGLLMNKMFLSSFQDITHIRAICGHTL